MDTHLTDSHTYETKCRRCGKIHDWWFAEERHISSHQFALVMEERIQRAETTWCEPCGNSTVHDIVSYTSATQKQKRADEKSEPQ